MRGELRSVQMTTARLFVVESPGRRGGCPVGKLAQIRHVKGVFAPDIARAAMVQNTRRVTTHVALELIASTNGAGVAELTTEQACERTGWAVGAVRRAFKELEDLGAIIRDEKVSWRFRWNAERLTALSAEHRAADERQVYETGACSGAEIIVFAALRDGFKRQHARETKQASGVPVVWAPAIPVDAEERREIAAIVESFADEQGHDVAEAARHLGQAYRRADAGAERSGWSWSWLFKSDRASSEAARTLAIANGKRTARTKSTPPPPANVNHTAAAAAAAAVARAAGGAR